jgi:predicted nuclease of predicted toxin-antitoxin system
VKLLLDENLPHRLRPMLIGHDVFTVSFMGWKGTENGALLARAAANGFDAVLTKDDGMAYQQNQTNLPCAVIILESPSNELAEIAPLVPALARLRPNSLVRVQ